MFSPRSIQSSYSLSEKIFSIDYTLFFSILLIGVISFFAQYSSSGGELDYYSKSHIVRFVIFFLFFIVVSFVQVRFWYQSSYFVYFLFFILLLGVKYFGVISSGSQRWINLDIRNLQLSELMKKVVISFFAE